MRIGLVDVDGHRFPNLAIMKLSAWHKEAGDDVGMAVAGIGYDRVYASKVFTFTKDVPDQWACDDIRRGGTGYGLRGELPYEVEHCRPDYGLYGIADTAYGFLTRGCPRGCPFCIVSGKEGRASRKVADLSEWWDGQRNIKLLDPNILACPDWRDLLGQLADSRAFVDFSQGVDIRLCSDDRIEALNRVRMSNIHFAWDNPKDDLLPCFGRYAAQARRKYHGAWGSVYVLCNFNSTHEEDMMRIEALRGLGYDPYVMVYDKEHAPLVTRDMQRWCNNKVIFRRCRNFSDYVPTRDRA